MPDCLHPQLTLRKKEDESGFGDYHCDKCEHTIVVGFVREIPPPKMRKATAVGYIEIQEEVSVEFEYPEGEHPQPHADKAIEAYAQEWGGEQRTGNVSGAVCDEGVTYTHD